MCSPASEVSTNAHFPSIYPSQTHWLRVNLQCQNIRRHAMPRYCFAAAILILAPCFAAGADTLPPPAAAFDFEKDIRPLLQASCVKCHSGAKPKGSFSLE